MKYKHTSETKQVLDDLINRVTQLVEVNELYKQHNPDLVFAQRMAFESCLVLLRQVRDTGKVMRGNEFVPDSIEPLAKTKWNKEIKLGV